jgi:hypothetical protein
MDQSNERTEIIHNDEEYLKIRKTKEILKESIINKIRIITFENEEKNKEVDSNVSIAAQITSKARIKLYKGFKDVIKKNGRVNFYLMCLLDFKRIRCHCSKIIINDLIRNQLNEI